MNPYPNLGPYVSPVGHYALLSEMIRIHQPEGIAMEFGVGSGESTRIIAAHMPVLGFDSFEGLPEDWREGFPAGSFTQNGVPPDLPNNVGLRIGRFEDIPAGSLRGTRSVGLLHVDCDLYSSAKAALELAFTQIERTPPDRYHGLIVVFDEYHGYEGSEQDEQRAWLELSAHYRLEWSPIGHSHQALAVKIA